MYIALLRPCTYMVCIQFSWIWIRLPIYPPSRRGPVVVSDSEFLGGPLRACRWLPQNCWFDLREDFSQTDGSSSLKMFPGFFCMLFFLGNYLKKPKLRWSFENDSGKNKMLWSTLGFNDHHPVGSAGTVSTISLAQRACRTVLGARRVSAEDSSSADRNLSAEIGSF